jgi:hypothetical protein
MRALGYATAITMAAAGTGLGVLAVKSLPVPRDEEDVTCTGGSRSSAACLRRV